MKTDMETAGNLVTRWGWTIHHEPSRQRLISMIAAAVMNAREEESERCAEICEFHGHLGMANAIRERTPLQVKGELT